MPRNVSNTPLPLVATASKCGALPPGFPGIEIDGEIYWDGGLVSNSPLEHVLAKGPRISTLVFQVDLFSARGDLPQQMPGVLDRQKDVTYSSRTRANTDSFICSKSCRRNWGRIPGCARSPNPPRTTASITSST